MRLAKLVLASSLAASCAFAEGIFVGVVGGYNFKTEVNGNDNDFEISGKQGFFGLKGGYDFGIWRAYGQYNYNLKTSENYDIFTSEMKGHEFLVGADWTPSINENLKLAVGPYLGYAKFKFEENDGTQTFSGNLDGFVLGGKVGAIFDTGIGEFEAGIKADKTWLKGEENDSYVIHDEDKITFGLYVGYNFKF